MTRPNSGVDIDVDYDVDHRLARRSLGGLWWLALLLIPLLLAALLGLVRGNAIEADLTRQASLALDAKGLPGVDVAFDGRDATLTLPLGTDVEPAIEAVKGIDGVRIVQVQEPKGGQMSDEGKDADPADDATGDAMDEGTAADADADTDTDAAAACGDLSGAVEAALTDAPIQFAESSATIAPSSTAVINTVAELLTDCDGSKVVVGGHTDNQGSPATSVPLSQRRADAVASALVSAGVAEDRITAKGYGESDPIADNATAEGRAENRRITIKVQ